MVKIQALMESLSSNLHGFLKKINKNLSLPNKKFLRDAMIGLLRTGKPIVCQMARQLPNQRSKFLSRLDRLEQHLVKDSTFEDNVKEALPQLWLPYISDETPIIVDLSDLAKPLAKKMDYLATAKGRQHEATGHWLLACRIVCLSESQESRPCITRAVQP